MFSLHTIFNFVIHSILFLYVIINTGKGWVSDWWSLTGDHRVTAIFFNNHMVCIVFNPFSTRRVLGLLYYKYANGQYLFIHVSTVSIIRGEEKGCFFYLLAFKSYVFFLSYYCCSSVQMCLPFLTLVKIV